MMVDPRAYDWQGFVGGGELEETFAFGIGDGEIVGVDYWGVVIECSEKVLICSQENIVWVVLRLRNV
jgi:hypothetical protein